MLWETIVLALQAIHRNSLRSILTVLGVVIGVGAVIAMVTVGQGSAVQVTADVDKLGTNSLLVLPGQDAKEGGPTGAARPCPIEALRHEWRRRQGPSGNRWPASGDRAEAVSASGGAGRRLPCDGSGP